MKSTAVARSLDIWQICCSTSASILAKNHFSAVFVAVDSLQTGIRGSTSRDTMWIKDSNAAYGHAKRASSVTMILWITWVRSIEKRFLLKRNNAHRSCLASLRTKRRRIYSRINQWRMSSIQAWSQFSTLKRRSNWKLIIRPHHISKQFFSRMIPSSRRWKSLTVSKNSTTISRTRHLSY